MSRAVSPSTRCSPAAARRLGDVVVREGLRNVPRVSAANRLANRSAHAPLGEALVPATARAIVANEAPRARDLAANGSVGRNVNLAENVLSGLLAAKHDAEAVGTGRLEAGPGRESLVAKGQVQVLPEGPKRRIVVFAVESAQ